MTELIPGDVEKSRSLARDLRQQAKELADAQAEARRQARDLVAQWRGDAATAYAAKVAAVDKPVRTMVVAKRQAAESLDLFAVRLARAKRWGEQAAVAMNQAGLPADMLIKGGTVPPIVDLDPVRGEALNRAMWSFTEARRTFAFAHRELQQQLRRLTADGALHELPADFATSPPLDNSPIALARRLYGNQVHPVNLPPELIAEARRQARAYGISEKLLLAILWQEQQWYQNWDPELDDPITDLGRRLNIQAQDTLIPDKSMGIAHMKPETAKDVAAKAMIMLDDGRYLKDLSNEEVARAVEHDPRLAVELAAAYLSQTDEAPAEKVPPGKPGSYGAVPDEYKFLLYAADTPEVRDLNEKQGLDDRLNAIGARAASWHQISPVLDDAAAWERLSPAERQAALQQLAADTPRPAPVGGYTDRLNVPYAMPGVETTFERSPGPPPASPSPGQRSEPSPTPGPAVPTPPRR